MPPILSRILGKRCIPCQKYPGWTVKFHFLRSILLFTLIFGKGDFESYPLLSFIKKMKIKQVPSILVMLSWHLKSSLFPHAYSVASVVSDSLQPMDCSRSGSHDSGILQTRIRQWIAISYYSGSSRPRDWTRLSYVSWIGRQVLYH